MRKITTLLFIILCVQFIQAQTNRTYFLGHSLVNFNAPNMTQKLADASSQTFSHADGIGIGASLYWQYINPQTADGSTWDTTLPKGGFENMLLTEALALKAYLSWNTVYYLNAFHDTAVRFNPGLKMYIYETWHCVYSGTGAGCEGFWDTDTAFSFRSRLVDDRPLWELMADTLNTTYGAGTAYMVPAGTAMVSLIDSIAAGKVPGITSVSQLFLDNIHLTNVGNYFVACVMYSTLLKRSPQGLPAQLTDPWDILYTDHPTTAQAAMFQKIAWETVCNHPKTGVNCSSTSIYDIANTNDVYIYPNPSSGQTQYIQVPSDCHYSLYDISGKVLQEGELHEGVNELHTSALSSGIYFVKAGNFSVKRIIK